MRQNAVLCNNWLNNVTSDFYFLTYNMYSDMTKYRIYRNYDIFEMVFYHGKASLSFENCFIIIGLYHIYSICNQTSTALVRQNALKSNLQFISLQFKSVQVNFLVLKAMIFKHIVDKCFVLFFSYKFILFCKELYFVEHFYSFLKMQF